MKKILSLIKIYTIIVSLLALLIVLRVVKTIISWLQEIIKKLVAIIKKAAFISVVLYGIILLTAYTYFRAQLVNTEPFIVVFSVILFIAELHTIFHLYGMFYSIWPRKYPKYLRLNRDKGLHINMFVCVCGEPVEIVRNTILGAKQAAHYYQKLIKPIHKPRVIILNDGFVAKKENRFEIAKLCRKLKVEHIARRKPGGFKAGNINNALSKTASLDPDNTIDIIFDSDFAAKKEFLTEITKPFTDKNIDFVQSPQRYQNEDTWVAKASAAHQIFFFDYVCPAKGYDNSLFLCGTNFAIRRSALESVGGLDTRFITEDYATSLNLHLSGKRGVFMPKVLALGFAPTSLKQYFGQQQRWSKGNFDVTRAYLKQILFGPLTIKQKLHYILSATYYLIGLRDLILMLAPIPYLFFDIPLIKTNTITFLAFVYGPLLVYNFILYTKTFKHPIKSIVLDIVSFPVFTVAFFSSLLQKNLAFVVTIKKYERENPFSVYKIQFTVAIILLCGLTFSLLRGNNISFGTYVNYFWAIFDVAFLLLGFFLIAKENSYLGIFDNAIKNVKSLLSPKRYFAPAKQFIIKSTVALTTSFTMFNFIGTIDSKGNFVLLPQAKTVQVKYASSQELLVPTNGVYYGYYLPELNKQPYNSPTNLMEGEKPTLVMYYQDWSKSSGFNKDFVQSLYNKNVIPVITWEPWDSQQTNTKLINQNEYSLEAIIQGKHDNYIRAWAKGAAKFKNPFFLRFAHEMNGNWYPWGNVNGNTPEDYKAMWIHVHDIFEQEGASNVIWAWTPNNTDENGNNENVLEYFPGHMYVDWVGFSGFNWGKTYSFNRWTSFKDLSKGIYQHLVQLNLPIMVAETSSVSRGGNKTLWLKKTLTEDIPSMKLIKAVIFYNQDFKAADFSLESQATHLAIENDITKNAYYIKYPLLSYSNFRQVALLDQE
ncbi:MAG: hypothetical protein A3D24_01380 [Candidatus Blackburnbacteria bacterium RIFCSPHIGHO2_02_FULL_39_13]|uniref:GH26 domain-containing protein n=1 Tax=Candidatus Blackburnbacteria bacterium RIFCSPLOWO2_01_FULL_40_20 TaxID=1797519 RepID=A0A1G1VFN0_9BACT|nr:MAG: Cellulose synthase (UDP-forming) [Microgenomates group bacterium GW2011_GWA2_39_19]OGY06781.1 MAG: hypothetical protein A2694_00485 [Candidatus Blackburnbacteria bacterium RIFCSPHIGHO2_01_FULL_40_17]OGY09796.1 MAG: hypothetical protein A3D24_01380 [Candidatus Blackburnbacteria bacterium RIFCSPHIGHO2_02_FULL_39_13]OGY14076.1 MAG: hypothetical protein A3A77_03825 [Candidatus Blackburnbacteria bacterium RIFCSPLOWO2_01_FULL_40_20]HBL52278.1 hypothetical protein [Candidatus Blackburnbacteria